MWCNLTRLHAEPVLSDAQLGSITGGSLIVNARVQMEPEPLESIVRQVLAETLAAGEATGDIMDLQCFSPAYPNPPYLVRE